MDLPSVVQILPVVHVSLLTLDAIMAVVLVCVLIELFSTKAINLWRRWKSSGKAFLDTWLLGEMKLIKVMVPDVHILRTSCC